MMHGLCSVLNPFVPYMKDGVYQKRYLKSFQKNTQESDSYPIYRRRDTGQFVETRSETQLNNRWVVLYNIQLITKYNTYINIEICSFILAVKYLYKNVYKGHDQATITLFQSDILSKTIPIDKIKMYLDARYILTSESIWKIFRYRMHGCALTIQRLAVHLLGQ